MGVHRVGFGLAADVRVMPVGGGAWARRDLASATRAIDAESLVAVAPETPCLEADERARARGVRHLFVVEGGRLVGVLCRCDLYPEPDAYEGVAARMASTVYALDATATLGEAAAAMKALSVGCLPVIERDRLVGVVTRGDLRRAGAPEPALGAHRCAACGSVHGVRPGAHSGLEYCLDCLDLQTALGSDCGEGD